MAVHTKDITPEDSIKEQLETYSIEVGTPFENSSKEAVARFSLYLETLWVADLGCGDGAATKYFQEEGITVVGVDINQDKLDLNPTDLKEKMDIISYLKYCEDIPNIFMHHSLEHLPNPQKVLDLISEKLAPGGYVYIEVPANDQVHSVHHSSFDTAGDIYPEGLELLEAETTVDEHYIIARKS